MASRLRKQRVALRFKRREQLRFRIHTALRRSIVVALVVGFGVGVVAGRDSILSRFVRQHTPQIRVVLPNALAGLPVLAELPQNAFLLWLPGVPFWLDKKLRRKYVAVRRVRLAKSWRTNSVLIQLEPRVPLVLWNNQGFDREGVSFPARPGAWKDLPQASFTASTGRVDLGRWLMRLASYYPFWSRVIALKQDMYGALELTTKSGTVILWGQPEKESIGKKVQALLRVLDDMHAHSGGTAWADLRFFDQGRIIVLPKSSRSP